MTKAGCLFHSYEFDDVNDTPPPAGFKPFYISHYGTHVCMGSNFQMVFYRNKTGKILVKILYNEKETTIPAISPFYDCYYEWDVLRAYLDKKVNQPSASPQVL